MGFIGFLIVVLLFFLLLVTFGGCEVIKESSVNKTASTSTKDILTQTTKSSFNQGVVSTQTDELDYTPSDPTKWMQTITGAGDTIHTKNTVITQRKKKVVEQKHEKINEEESVEDNSIEIEIEKLKQYFKKKEFQNEVILYVAGGICLILLLVMVYISYQFKNLSSVVHNVSK